MLLTVKDLFPIFLSILLVSCSGGEMDEAKATYRSLSDVPASKWEQLAEKKIYFGHQSVGLNIIDGIKDIMRTNQKIRLRIVEGTYFSADNKGALYHSVVGANKSPLTKMRAFEDTLTKASGSQIDIAFLKLCYVDFNSETKANDVFDQYSKMITNIRKTNKKTKIIHFTSPLTTNANGFKPYIKRILGRTIGGQPENIRRSEYNELIISAFAGSEPVLDIAKLESTKSNGSRMAFTKAGKSYMSLAPEFTCDGGHLNEAGRKKVAEHLLLLIISNL